MQVDWPCVMFLAKTVLVAVVALLSAIGNLGSIEDAAPLRFEPDGRPLELAAPAVSRCSSADGTCHDEYVTYDEGSATGWPPVVLSAPHAGRLGPDTIPDRDAGCWDSGTAQCVWTHDCGVKNWNACKATTDDDFATFELATLIRDNLCKLFAGQCPALVVNNLLRVKFDANRNRPEASFGVAEVEAAFDKYNAYIESAKLNIVRHHGAGLFVDVHGHGHRLQKAELGYIPRAADLDSGREIEAAETSIRNLGSRHAHIAFDDLLRGEHSFGAFLEKFGYPAVPSPSSRGPGTGNPYYNGGYLSRRHGSKESGSIDSIQIESARSFREIGARQEYARAVANSIRHYVCHYYVTSQREISTTQRDVIAADCQRTISSGSQQRISASISLAYILSAAILLMPH